MPSREVDVDYEGLEKGWGQLGVERSRCQSPACRSCLDGDVVDEHEKNLGFMDVEDSKWVVDDCPATCVLTLTPLLVGDEHSLCATRK